MLHTSPHYYSPGFEVLDAFGTLLGKPGNTEEEALLNLASSAERRYEGANGLLSVSYEPCGFRKKKVEAVGSVVTLTRQQFYYIPSDVCYREVTPGTVVRLYFTDGHYADVLLYGSRAKNSLHGVQAKLLRSPWQPFGPNVEMLVSQQSQGDVRVAYQSPLIFPMQRLSRTDTVYGGASVGFSPEHTTLEYAIGTINRVEVRSTQPPARQPRKSLFSRLFS